MLLPPSLSLSRAGTGSHSAGQTPTSERKAKNLKDQKQRSVWTMSTLPRTLGPNLRLHENVITDRGSASLAQSPGFSSQHFIELNWGYRGGSFSSGEHWLLPWDLSLVPSTDVAAPLLASAGTRHTSGKQSYTWAQHFHKHKTCFKKRV